MNVTPEKKGKSSQYGICIHISSLLESIGEEW
jgi:hypothetical protein